MHRVLFIDDDPQAQKTLKMVLDGRYDVRSCFTGKQGVERVEQDDPDVVLLDINLPDRDGLDVLDDIKKIPLAPPVVMLTAFSETDLVVAAIKKGACDYVVKPYDLKKLVGTIRQAIENRRDAPLVSISGAEAYLDKIIGESPAISRLKSLIQRYGTTGLPVMIQGESGTGKELVARAIHELSGRQGSFVPMNCGAIPETLIETELFGSEKGAFTDAVHRAGAFEQADGGTLFLDEIGDMPLNAQVKLLRALEEKEVTRLGSSGSIPVNVRVVAATHRDLKQMMLTHDFRQDLYYRLNVLAIEVPPLRQHREDLPILATYFLQGAAEQGYVLGCDGLERLMNHDWPGNVRELRNVVQRATILAEGGTISSQDILLY